jgi:hypothetical protein
MERQMNTETKKVLSIAAVIVAMGMGAVESTRNQAQADPMLVPGGAAGYAGARVDAAFDLVAAMPPMPAVTVPLAEKGDLQVPAGCVGLQGDQQAECMDVAYEVPSNAYTIVEERTAQSSILMRTMGFLMAGVNGSPGVQAQ